MLHSLIHGDSGARFDVQQATTVCLLVHTLSTCLLTTSPNTYVGPIFVTTLTHPDLIACSRMLFPLDLYLGCPTRLALLMCSALCARDPICDLLQIFDPLGLSDGAEPGDIKLWREAELKHGRVAMLASLGVLVAEVRRRSSRVELSAV